MRGMIRCLASNTKLAKLLTKTFVDLLITARAFRQTQIPILPKAAAKRVSHIFAFINNAAINN